MCICLYVSNINFFYSNFLSFASVPVPHHAGVGWLCTSIAFEVAQSNTEQLCLQKAQFSLCSSLSQDTWTGLVWHRHPTCQPVGAVKYLDRHLHLSVLCKALGQIRVSPRCGWCPAPRACQAGRSWRGALKPGQTRTRRFPARPSDRWEQTWGHTLIQARIQDHDPIESLSKPRH